MRTLEKQKQAEGKGGYGKIPGELCGERKDCLKNWRPLEVYRLQRNLKKSLFYKYVGPVKKEIKNLSMI